MAVILVIVESIISAMVLVSESGAASQGEERFSLFIYHTHLRLGKIAHLYAEA